MAGLIDLSELQEQVILVAVNASGEEDTNASLDELEELACTAGAVSIGRMIQNREKVHPGTYLGKGKIDELRELLWDTKATGIICDDEFKPGPAEKSGGCPGYKGHGSHYGDTGYFCSQS